MEQTERERTQTDRTTNLDFSALDDGGVQGLPRRVGVRTVCECHEAESLERGKRRRFSRCFKSLSCLHTSVKSGDKSIFALDSICHYCLRCSPWIRAR